VPFDVAFSLESHEMAAWTIIIGQQNGGTWDWKAMRWCEDKK
jgi:hypothetical protein